MKVNHLTFTTFLFLVLFTTGFSQVPNYVPTNGLVGWWPFNGNANDESGNGNDATPYGAIPSPDRFGLNNKAYFLQGSGNYIQTNLSSVYMNQNLTFSIWFNPTQFVTYFNCLIKNGNFNTNTGEQYGVGVNLNGQIHSGIKNTSCSSGQGWVVDIPNQNVQLNTWNHLSVTVSLDTMKTYLNNQLISSFPFNGSLVVCPELTQLTFGKEFNVSANQFFGIIDDIGIWDRALTDQEISNLYFGCQDSLTSEPSNQSVSLGNSVNFTTSFSDPNSTFQWQTNLGLGFQDVVDAGQYQGGTNDTLTISNVNLGNDNQQFRCIVSSNLCSDTTMIATLSVNNNTGFDDSKKATQIVISPNPTQKEITISLKNLDIGDGFVLEFKNQLGQSLFKHLLKETETTISLMDNIETGIYFVNIKDPADNIIDIKRIIVQ